MSISQVIFTPIVVFIEKIGPHPTSGPLWGNLSKVGHTT
jgi:hypothetical protein